MREANYWDLLSIVHYIIAILFLVGLFLEIRAIISSIRRKKTVRTLALVVCTVFTLLFGVIVYGYVFPNGALHHPRYRLDRVMLRQTQVMLEEYKNRNGAYPTTEQGLNPIYSKRADSNCSTKCGTQTDYKYVSNGKTYELESTHDYSISGLVVYGTNELTAEIYIRK